MLTNGEMISQQTWELEADVHEHGTPLIVLRKNGPYWSNVCTCASDIDAKAISILPNLLSLMGEVENELGVLDASGDHVLLESTRVTDLLNQIKILKDELSGRG